MENRRLKKPIAIGIYSFILIGLFGIIYLIESNISKNTLKTDEESVVETIENDSIPVVASEDVMIKPYTDTELKILKNYYDYQAEESNQVNSIFIYDNTYLQSTGISYGGKDDFEVVTVLGGIVQDVKDDTVLGKIVEIKHGENVVSIYQCLSDVTVKIDDVVPIGQVIAKGGNCNLDKDNKQLYFELLINGTTVNPENYYGKKISEL
ncbi:MAG: peptidoglycan DD-metalloendopeptidase family protein [Bacilli bacterium]